MCKNTKWSLLGIAICFDRYFSTAFSISDIDWNRFEKYFNLFFHDFFNNQKNKEQFLIGLTALLVIPLAILMDP